MKKLESKKFISEKKLIEECKKYWEKELKLNKEVAASLVNSQKCTFDSDIFKSFPELLDWCKGRGGKYSLLMLIDKGRITVKVINNRFYDFHVIIC